MDNLPGSVALMFLALTAHNVLIDFLKQHYLCCKLREFLLKAMEPKHISARAFISLFYSMMYTG